MLIKDKEPCRRLSIRGYRLADCQRLTELFYNTVHVVNAKDYDKKQLDAWATGTVDLARWNQELENHYTLIAVIDDEIVGFGDIDEAGYLDRLFVHADYQKMGIGTALCDGLEQFADKEIVTHASIAAKDFFLNRGYRVIKEQQVQRQGVLLKNYVMKKFC